MMGRIAEDWWIGMSEGVADEGLERVAEWFRSLPDAVERFGDAIRQSFDEVFDGQRTGRYDLRQLSKVEKTYIGTKVEIVVQAAFGLAQGQRMDYLIVGEEVDAKWSMRSGGWMIPTEAVGEICLCLTADDYSSVFSAGVLRASDEHLRESRNKDQKRYLSRAALDAMTWIAHEAPLPENLLLGLDTDTRSAILDYRLSGQRRVNELFRRVQGRLVRREVVLTVAQQGDGPKRVRDARRQLREEGILVLGHQNDHPRIAESLGLPVPPKGSWVSCRVREAEPGSDGVRIADCTWRLADAAEGAASGPSSY